MKTANYNIIGIVLLAGVLLAAIALQLFSSGLISSDVPPPRTTVIAPHMTEETVPIIRIHTRTILALLGGAGVGLLFLLRAKHHRAHAA